MAGQDPPAMSKTGWSCCARISRQRDPPGTQDWAPKAQGPAQGPAPAATNWAMDGGPSVFMEERDRRRPLGQQSNTLYEKLTMWRILRFLDVMQDVPLFASGRRMKLFLSTYYICLVNVKISTVMDMHYTV